jgi:hypothetical protein
MNLNIEIPDDVGNMMRNWAAAAGKDLESFVEQVVVEVAKDVEAEASPSPSNVDDFIRRQDAWVALHPRLDHAIDDGRESFYAGRE